MNRRNNYRRLIIFLIFIFIISINSSYAAPLLRTGSDQSVSINFDNRFGPASAYSDSKTFYIYNDGNTSMTISSVTVDSPGSGITMSIYSNPYSVSAGGSGTITVSFNVPSSVSTGTYNGVINVVSTGGTGKMNLVLVVNTKIPAKLGSIGRRSNTIKFDKPKGSVPSFQSSESITLSNIGDSILYIDNIYTDNPNSDITFSISGYSTAISPKGSSMATLVITAQPSAREGTFSGKITVTTSKEGRYGGKLYGSTETEYVDVSVIIEYGVNMEVAKTSINFGDTELLSPKEDYIDIRETLGYKSISGIKITKSGPSKWLSISPDSLSSINAFGSERISAKLLYEGDAELYKNHEWTYTISTGNAGSKSFKVTATNVPPDVKPTLEKICSSKYNNHEGSKAIAEKMCRSLTYGDTNIRKNNFPLNELISLISIGNSAVNLLDSYATADAYINNGDHNGAYEHLMKGVVATKIINTYAEKVSDYNVKNDINFVNENSGNLMNALLEKETNYYESKKDSDALQSMIAYERLSDMWGILGNEKMRQDYSVLAKEKFEQHNNLVDAAKNSKLEAENTLREVKDSYLSKWGGLHILTNPFYYSKVSGEYDTINSKYEDAMRSYTEAGEKESANKTNEELGDITSEFNKIKSIFFIFTGFYTLIFLGVLSRSTKAMMAYVRDTSETHMGDNFL